MADTIPKAPTLEAVRAHALELQSKLLKEQGITVTPDDVTAAQMVPGFSAQTAPLSEQTGEPFEAPTIGGEQTVTATGEQLQGSPDTPIAGGEAAVEAAADQIARARDKTGKFVPAAAENPTDTAGKAAAGEAAPAAAAQAREAAVEGAAAQITRNWDDYDEVVYEDGDNKYTVLAKKDEAAAVKNGYARRAIMDRHSTYLSRARPVLEPLITDGRILQVLPLIERALSDPEYGNFVVEAYERRTKGLPLTQAQAQAAQIGDAITTAATAQPTATPQTEGGEYDDPWLRQALTPLQEELRQTREMMAQLTAREQAQLAQQQAARQAQEDANRMVLQTHQELSALYPDQFSGDFNADKALLARVHQYGNDAGYFRAYGYNPASYRLAYLGLREGNSDTASTAAQTINRAQRVEAAASRHIEGVPAGKAAAQAPAPRAKGLPQMRDKDGKLLSPRDYAERVVRQIAPGAPA